MKLFCKSNKPFISGDPFTCIFKGKIGASGWHIAIAFALIVNIPIILWSLKNNAFYSTQNFVGLYQDFAWWINQSLAVPATILFFFWMPEGIKNVINGLAKNGVLSIPKDSTEQLSNFITRFDRIYSHWVWFILSSIIITTYTFAIVVPVFTSFNTWQTTGNFLFWYTTLFWNLMFILMALIVVRGIIAIAWFNKLFKEFEIDIKILHPDKAGGLSPLGSFSVVTGYFIGILGITVVLSASIQTFLITGQFNGFELNAPVIVQILVYLVLAPYTFFAPIGAAHSAMRKTKNNAVLKISEQFNRDFHSLEIALDSNPAELEEKFKKVEFLQKLHDTVDKFPVWPFNIANLIRFFSSVGSPIFFAFLPSLIEPLLK